MKKTIFILLLSVFTVRAEESGSQKHCYIQVTADFKAANDGYRSGCNVLKTVTDTAGNHYVSSNALNEFPELFDARTRANFYWLTPDDFPKDTSLKGTF